MRFFFATMLVMAQAASSSTAAAPPPKAFFTQAKHEFRAGYTEPVLEFDLPFTNSTDKPLKVLSVETSCTCMKVSVAKLLLEPGEAGQVHCVFTVPNATGPVQKPVILTTDAPNRPSEATLARVEVPSILRSTPERLTWTVNSPATEKTFRITIADDSSLHLTKVECSRDLFVWSLQTIREGREYELHVKPKDTAQPALGMFLVHTDSTVPRQKRHCFYAVIEPAPISTTPVP